MNLAEFQKMVPEKTCPYCESLEYPIITHVDSNIITVELECIICHQDWEIFHIDIPIANSRCAE